MASERLTDEQLAHAAARIAEDQPKCHVCNGRGFRDVPNMRGVVSCSVCEGTGFFALGTMTIRSIVAELRALRLSNDDREALRWAKACCERIDGDYGAGSPLSRRALAVLARLIGGER